MSSITTVEFITSYLPRASILEMVFFLGLVIFLSNNVFITVRFITLYLPRVSMLEIVFFEFSYLKR